MPRIPQGEFQTVPSSRVGSAGGVMQRGPDLANTVAPAMANLTNAMAQLQDQTERTQAYAEANKVKQTYMQKKVQYETALNTVNGDGITDYIDPTDMSTDPAKRKRIQVPIQEMYEDMVSTYREGQKNLGNLTRADIAKDLAQQYVGDDLIQTQIKTNKQINRRREKDTLEAVTQNMELNLSSFVEKATTSDGGDPERLKLDLAYMENKIAREVGTISGIIGRDNTAQVLQLKDRAYASAATQIISTGVTGTTVQAADTLVSRIRDPQQRSLATTRLENTKKTTATVKNVTMLNSAQDIKQSIVSSPVLNDADYVKSVQTTKNLLNMYTDPKYSQITDEQKNAAAVDLLSTALAKRQLQENLEVDLTFLDNPESDVADLDIPDTLRAPSSEGSVVMGPRRAQLDQAIAQELHSSGLNGLLGDGGMSASVREMTISKMRSLKASMKEDLPEMIGQKYPHLQGREKLERIQQVANAQALGEVSLVGKKFGSQFRQEFQSMMAREPMQAVQLFNSALADAGPAYEGEGSYRRAMAIDIVAKDPKLAYLIPMADAEPAMQAEMARNAAVYNTIIKETDASETTFQEAFSTQSIPALDALRFTNPSVYAGVKQAIFHKAAVSVRNKGDVPRALKEASVEMGKMYTAIPSGDSTVFALNRSGKSYADQRSQMEKGLKQALTLPSMDDDAKAEILERYGAKGVITRNSEGKVVTPKAHVNWLLQRLVKIEPDGRYPNMHIVKVGNSPMTKKDGTIIKVSADDILGYGEAYDKETDRLLRGY